METARKVGTQHRLIGSLLEGVRQALAASQGEWAMDRLLSLHRSLEAHFLLEENHYFPMTREARPDLVADLERLVEEHRRMRSELEGVETLVDGSDWAGAARALDALDTSFRSHEKLEARILEA